MLKHFGIRTRDSVAGFIFALPAITGMLVFYLIPFIIGFMLSLTDGINTRRFVGLKNFIDMFGNSTFRLAAINTGKFIAVAVPLIFAVSLVIAVMLSKKLKGSNFFRSSFIFPLVLPIASVIIVFEMVFANEGLVNMLLAAMGFPLVDWLKSSGAFTVLVTLYIWKNCGYNIILFTAAINSIPPEYYESAELFGAGEYRKLRYITLPLILPHTFLILVFSIINAFKTFREAFILCGDYPHQSIYMLQHFMNNNFRNLNYVRLATGATIVFLAIFILVYLMFMTRKRWGELE